MKHDPEPMPMFSQAWHAWNGRMVAAALSRADELYVPADNSEREHDRKVPNDYEKHCRIEGRQDRFV